MRRFIIIFTLAICLVACNHHSEHWATITEMESIIEERPDSVLNVLQAIDMDKLVGDEERAKHALLLSMALDKNYIDRTDFEVLQPAIDYYDDNGSATDKLRTYYYQGRIYQNQGNDALGMECFVNAISKGGKSKDLQTMAKIYYNQSKIYNSLYEWDNSIEYLKKAATLYKDSGLYHYYIDCLILIINGYILKEDYDSASSYIEQCKQISETMNEGALSLYYSVYLTYLIRCGSEYEINQLINEYINTIPNSHIDWLTLCNAYYKIGKYDDALQATEQYRSHTDTSDELKYKALISMIYEKTYRYEESLRAYKEFMVVSDSTSLAIMRQDTKFVEERHNLEMAKARETDAKNRLTIIVLGCTVAVLALLIVVYIIRKRLLVSRNRNILLESEKALYEQMYNEVVAERDALNEMIANNTIKEEAMEVIKKRLDVLNKVIISQITGTTSANKKAYEELESLLANKENFIESTRLSIEGNNPEFITALKQRGLTDEEINICCLYAIGLKGKDIKAYTNQSRHYNQSADIRHKLGLTESDTNLSIFLRDMLEKYEL